MSKKYVIPQLHGNINADFYSPNTQISLGKRVNSKIYSKALLGHKGMKGSNCLNNLFTSKGNLETLL